MPTKTLKRLALAFAAISLLTTLASAQQSFMYFGTYTGFKFVSYNRTHGNGDSHSKGIYVSRFNASTGAVTPPVLAAESINPSFLVTSHDGRFVYAVNEDPESLGPENDHASYISAFAVDPSSGKLRLLNQLPTGGTSTCYLSLDKTGHFALMTNFGNGSISVIRIKPDGSLGELTAFVQHIGDSGESVLPSGPHPHSIDVSPDNKHVIVAELGLSKLYVYNFDDTTGRLSPMAPKAFAVPPHSGTRHFIFGPTGNFGYALNEVTGTVDVYAWDAANADLKQVQEVHLKDDRPESPYKASAEEEISHGFLYESNRFHMNGEPEWLTSSIGVYKISPADGKLSEVQQISTEGVLARDFTIDPTGHYLFALHQLSNTVVEFRIGTDGKLTSLGKVMDLDTPVCLQFTPVR